MIIQIPIMGARFPSRVREQVSLFLSQIVHQPLEGAVPSPQAGTVIGDLLSHLLNRGVTSHSHPERACLGPGPSGPVGYGELFALGPLAEAAAENPLTWAVKGHPSWEGLGEPHGPERVGPVLFSGGTVAPSLPLQAPAPCSEPRARCTASKPGRAQSGAGGGAWEPVGLAPHLPPIL